MAIGLKRLLCLWTVFLFSLVSAQFSEETYYKTCSHPSGVLCFGISLQDQLDQQCKKNCDLAVSIFEDKRYPGKVRFQLWGKPMKDLNFNGTYIAVGLSDDEWMGYDSVVECVSKGTNEKPKIYTSWNLGKSSNKRTTDKSYITKDWITVKDKSLFCDFTRDAKTQVEGKVFDLKNGPGYHILLAMGNADPKNERISYHSTRVASRGPILNTKTIVLHEPPHYSGASFSQASSFILFLFYAFAFFIKF